jgi:hypothetical protein
MRIDRRMLMIRSCLMEKSKMSDQVIYTSRNGKVRVVTRPPVTEFGDTVFVQTWADSDWRDVCSYNSMSDDYAYSNAKDYARRLNGGNR